MRTRLRSIALAGAVTVGGFLVLGTSPARAQGIYLGRGGGFSLNIGGGGFYPGYGRGFYPGYGYGGGYGYPGSGFALSFGYPGGGYGPGYGYGAYPGAGYGYYGGGYRVQPYAYPIRAPYGNYGYRSYSRGYSGFGYPGSYRRW